MKRQNRKGATLSMVILTMVIITALVAVTASVINTNSVQTIRMARYLKAKYVAVSGSQLVLGAYYGEEGAKTPTPLYEEFRKRAEGDSKSTEKVTSSHIFPNGTAEIEVTGAFETDPETGKTSTDKGDYNITIISKAKLEGSEDYYVHTVVINWFIEGIRSEKGGLKAPKA